MLDNRTGRLECNIDICNIYTNLPGHPTGDQTIETTSRDRCVKNAAQLEFLRFSLVTTNYGHVRPFLKLHRGRRDHRNGAKRYYDAECAFQLQSRTDSVVHIDGLQRDMFAIARASMIRRLTF